MAQLGLYGGKVTAGGTDGALLSTTNALRYDAERGTLGTPVTYALRCPIETNVYNVAISIGGTNPDWVELSADGTIWGASVSFDNVGDINVLFYVRVNIPESAGYNQTVLNNMVLKYLQTVTE